MTPAHAQSLDSAPRSVRAARRMLEEVCDGLSTDRLDDARLIVSELVTNAVLHGEQDGGVGVSLAWNAPILRIEVRSAGAFGLSDGQGPAHGRGLRLIEALSDRWGIDTGPATTVWAEVREHSPRRGLADG